MSSCHFKQNSTMDESISFSEDISRISADKRNESWSVLRKDSTANTCDVKVYVRVRPQSAKEQESNSKRIVSVRENKIVVVNPNAFDADPDVIASAATFLSLNEYAKVFDFDKCFWSYEENSSNYADQETVFQTIGSDIVENVLNGISSCCFSYGGINSG